MYQPWLAADLHVQGRVGLAGCEQAWLFGPPVDTLPAAQVAARRRRRPSSAACCDLRRSKAAVPASSRSRRGLLLQGQVRYEVQHQRLGPSSAPSGTRGGSRDQWNCVVAVGSRRELDPAGVRRMPMDDQAPWRPPGQAVGRASSSMDDQGRQHFCREWYSRSSRSRWVRSGSALDSRSLISSFLRVQCMGFGRPNPGGAPSVIWRGRAIRGSPTGAPEPSTARDRLSEA